MQSDSTPAETAVNPLGVGAAAVAVSSWGLATVIVKGIDMGSLAIGVYRFTIFGVVLVAFLATRGTPLSVRVMRESMWGGIALGADIALFFSAVKLTSVANATVIGSLQPVVIALVSVPMFGERISPRSIALGAVAVGGAIAVVLFGADDATSSLTGDALAVGALISWAAYFIFSRRAKEKITSNEYTAGTSIWTAAINLPLAIAFGQSLAWPSTTSWVWLLILTFGSGLLGHSMMNWSIQQIPLWISSTFTLLIAVIGAIAAWIWLNEPLVAAQVVAMGVVLAALAGIITAKDDGTTRPRLRLRVRRR